jgi:hypothetical protein
MHKARFVMSSIAVLWIGLVGWNSGCSSNNNGTSDGGDDGSGSGSGGGASSGFVLPDGNSPGNTMHTCTADNLVCTGGCTGTTTISGRVFDPAGKNPVNAVAVWVPYTAPSKMPTTLTCNCSELYTGQFVGTYAVTDATGYFKIDPAPSGKNGAGVPLVVQIGKWRYQTSVSVTCGQDNPIPDKTLRLPQGRPGTGVQFAGDLPKIAISTGGADTLECLLTRIGVAQTEYGGGAGGAGQIHIYQGSPVTAPTTPNPAPQSSAALWDTATHLENYDAVLLSCEGAPTMNASPANLYTYATMGGRVFASHYHYQWFLGTPWNNLGTWFTQKTNQLNNPTLGVIQTKLPNGVPFIEGQAMLTWLQYVKALDANMELSIAQARHNVDVGMGNVGVPWMYFDSAKSAGPVDPGNWDPLSPTSTLYFSYDTKGVQAESSCGRIVYSDLHVGGNSGDYGESPNSSGPPPGRTDVPAGCNANVDLSAQEKALEFMLFDLTSCLAPPGGDAGTVPPFAK